MALRRSKFGKAFHARMNVSWAASSAASLFRRIFIAQPKTLL
jgi:hypothetical protein